MRARVDRLASRLASLGRPARERGALLPADLVAIEGVPARMAFRRAATGEPTCVFLPGYPDTLHVFSRVIARLRGEVGYLALDFPGQGGSAPRPACESPDDRAQWLERVARTFGIDRVRVFGHDMGAQTAFAWAERRQVERLVMSHALLDPFAKTSRAIRLLRTSGAYRVLLPAFPELVVARCLSTFLPRSAPLTRAVEDDVRRAFVHGGAAHTVGPCDAAEIWVRRRFDPTKLSGVRPVLVWGDREPHFPVAHADRFAERIPSERVNVRGGHHWLCWHAPGVVIDALLS